MGGKDSCIKDGLHPSLVRLRPFRAGRCHTLYMAGKNLLLKMGGKESYVKDGLHPSLVGLRPFRAGRRGIMR